MELAEQFEVLALAQRWENIAREITNAALFNDDATRDETIESYNKVNILLNCATELRDLLANARKRAKL